MTVTVSLLLSSGEFNLNKIDLRSMTLDELTEKVKELELPKFRANQIYSWAFQKGVTDFSEMTNLSKDLKETLEKHFTLTNCRIDIKLKSQIDDTVKYLFELNKGEFVECVVMKYKYGYSICISSQLGCKMGCTFCASAIGGFKRNLLPSEMLSEILTAQNDLGVRISHIVLMGTGEPLDNYDNVTKFLELVTSENSLNISMRHISLSTCGIVPKIYDLAEKKLGLTLSVSLHAPNDKIRSLTMPVNNKCNIDELIAACKYYTKTTSRRISFEYAMINGFNDTDECASELANRLRGMLCHVNLIPINSVKEKSYKRSSDDRLKRFSDILTKRGITVTVRRTLGSDINASCGQLRASKVEGDRS
ncbi:MAG: 23S rRNA (adenine(2503)-C(2))-methyltransferase RlmN [Oscillospiraceae bacterium]